MGSFQTRSFLIIPPDIASTLLPPDTLSVSEFLNYSIPPQILLSEYSIADFLSNQDPSAVDVSEMQHLPMPPKSIVRQIHQHISEGSIHYRSIISPYVSNNTTRYPLWIVIYWLQLEDISTKQKFWSKLQTESEKQLKRQKNQSAETKSLLRKAHNHLQALPWTGPLHGVRGETSIDKITIYLTKEWLADDHIHHILELINRELEATMMPNMDKPRFIIQESTHFLTLMGQAQENPSTYHTTSYDWLRHLGESLVGAVYNQFGTVINLGGNHWVACIIDFRKETIHYGDSLGKPIPTVSEAAVSLSKS
ncbi:hypothetical protein FA15DRAFT_662084 [Coprinopsis marcescibilis]|uniref:Ubiquitin-like protease family profile domain-containing protein n=1 Tax=Coprinopsis marcescibilis TaxID=230819 RepID=A0A5C3K9L8_COPMA|nr:hypothetical protein FA15DRAFT_662084 [Coprinopsis marcescibilis]